MSRCLCGHMHGLDGCGKCWCTSWRRGPKVRIGNRWVYDISRGGSAYFAPRFHLEAYGINNGFVQEAIRKGVYFDIEPEEPTAADALDAESRRVGEQLGLL